jgi:hypothetical protein
MKVKSLIVVGALAGFAAMTTTAASAAIVCNNADSVCWHTKRAYTYRPEYGVVVHPNNWAWAPTEHFTWREHAGRGYWRNGVWIHF